MIWLAWRQFRAQALHGGDRPGPAGRRGCSPPGPAWPTSTPTGSPGARSDCGQFMDGFVDQHQRALLALTALVLLVPALLGLFWGAPLVARELDAGTHRLVWNQSVTRSRWLTVKLVLVGSAGAAVAGLVVWGVDRWSTPLDAASQHDPRLPMAMTFAASGVVPLAYAVFAFALGVTVGMLTKRVIPAMAITLVVFRGGAVRRAVAGPPHLAPSYTSVDPITSADPAELQHHQRRHPPERRCTGARRLAALAPHGGRLRGATVDVLPASLMDAPECAPSTNKGIDPCLDADRLGGLPAGVRLPSAVPVLAAPMDRGGAVRRRDRRAGRLLLLVAAPPGPLTVGPY